MKSKIKKKPIVVAVSGGFDPLHVGHVRMFAKAKALGDKLVVILNNDNWLKLKKGFSFMPESERKELIENIRWVDKVVISSHKMNSKDMSCGAELRKIKPDIFANGGDRNVKDSKDPKSSLFKDEKVCREIGTKMIFNVGHGGKVQSSSWLLEAHKKRKLKK